MLNIIMIVIQVASALALIFLILLHSGRGGGLSDMFGGGQLGGSMAGSTVVERNLDRLTVVTGVIFIFSTVLLALRLD
jgi:preprotein translocase subunit SecG